MADINKVWLSGMVVSNAMYTKLPSNTPITTFTLQVNEQFSDRSGIVQVKPNLVRVESLGKSAENVANKVRQGTRYMIDGYLRQDSSEGIRVRTFAVYPDDTLEDVCYKEGLKQAVKILKTSRDVNAAVEKIEEILVQRK